MSDRHPDCVFCKIVAGEAEASIKAAWADAILIAPLNPVTVGHVLVIPRRHVMDALTDPTLTGAMFAHAAEWAGWPCNLITSAGPAATQTVMHLHVHVVPRQEHDGLPLPWTPQQEAQRA